MPRRVSLAKLGAVAGATACAGLAAAGVVLHLLDRAVPANRDLLAWWAMGAVAAVSYGVTGGWLAAARPRLVIGWLLLAIGWCQALSLAGPQYLVHALQIGHALPGDRAALWVGNWTWRTGLTLIGLVLPLLLPDGRLGSRRWRPAMVLALAAVAAGSVEAALTPYDVDAPSLDLAGVQNPTTAALPAWLAALPLFSLGTAVSSLVWRWRAGGRVQRQQLKWIMLGFAATFACFAAGFTAGPVLTAAAMLPLPLACLVAAMRYGLWDVDVVLSRTLRYALLVLSALVVYTVVVDLLGRSLGAPLVAAAVVALGVEPLNRLLRANVNRLVHGRRDDPYATLAGIARRLSAARDADAVSAELLPEVTAAVAATLRLPYVAVELADGERVAVEVADGERVAVGPPASSVERIPLRYGGAVVGTLVVAPGPDGLGRAERRLLAALADSAAVAAHTVALTRDLVRSRRELVTAREEERRRLYRELHDGFGPLLAATALQAETARDVALDDPAAAVRVLDAVVPRLRGAVDDVRGIVHGLRPPAIDDLGLASAVRELAGRFGVAVEAAEPLGAVPAAVEVAAYRIVAEALTNASRHAGASTIRVTLCRDRDELRVAVEDDGRGLPTVPAAGLGLASMRARAAELHGELLVGAGTAGAGTRIEARLPLEHP